MIGWRISEIQSEKFLREPIKNKKNDSYYEPPLYLYVFMSIYMYFRVFTSIYEYNFSLLQFIEI